MPKIYNTDLFSVQTGQCKLYGDNCMLISINDPGCEAKPKQVFKGMFYFEFLDTHDKSSEFAITDQQAEVIADVLRECYAKDIDVVVHCHMGICRSGAVAEIGEMLGFEYVGTYKQPNCLVKHKIMKCFGWTYD